MIHRSARGRAEHAKKAYFLKLALASKKARKRSKVENETTDAEASA